MAQSHDKNHTSLPPKFVLDGSLGDIAKFLRIMGFPAKLIQENLLQERIDVGQTVITRSKELGNALRKRGKQVLILPRRAPNEGLERDLRRIVEVIGPKRMIPYVFCTPFCQGCNTPLQIRDANELTSLIPEKSLQYLSWVYYCSICNKTYWLGSHWKRIRRVLEYVLAGYDVIIPQPWQKIPPCQKE